MRAPSSRPESRESAIRIDAHQHFWRLERGDCRWLGPGLAEIHRDFGPDDLAPHLERAGIGRTVLVQAADTVEETRYLLGVAQQTPFVAGVVGWILMDSPRAVSELERLAAHPRLVGLRPMIQDLADDDWMLRPALEPALRALVERGLAFDALVRPRHLRNLLALLERHPELRVVVDHGAKPKIPKRGETWPGLEAWKRETAEVARAGASCKLSGLVTEAAPDWTVEDLRPAFDALLESFGPSRLLWGSDWPVVNLAGGYEAWWDATRELLAPLPEAHRDAILGGNALRLYRLRP